VVAVLGGAVGGAVVPAVTGGAVVVVGAVLVDELGTVAVEAVDAIGAVVGRNAADRRSGSV